MSNYSFLSTDELLLINILNTMYNDNYRQIEQLQESNTRILTSIMNMLANVLHTRERNRQGNLPSRNGNTTSNRREGNTTTQPASLNTNNVRRIHNSTTSQNALMNFLNNGIFSNSPYMVDNIEYIHSNPSSRNGTNINSNINELLQSFLQPIEVFPTPSQIEIATRIVRFADIVNPLNSSCPISMERFNDSDSVSVIRECGHIFSTQELQQWFRSNCRCPVCRYDIRNYNPSSNRRQQERNSSRSVDSNTDMSNNVIPNTDMSNNVIPNTDMSNNVIPNTDNMINSFITTSNIVFTTPHIHDISGNNLNVNDITRLLFDYYTRGT